ncbi:MAG: patatin-like phospholipase family protein, partial [Candidatus Izemoplasmatales bacterium]|nr:patatin-like phospholipase family protein [Candidatus Izemoplasmatales bacterium]
FKETGVFEINGLASLLQQNLDFQRLREKQVFVTLSDGGETNEGIFGLMKATYQHYIKKDSKVVYAPLHDVEDNEAVIRQILASCSIPIAFAPQKMEDHQYFDGGVYDNVPVQPLIDSGCDTIIIIHLNLIQFFDPKKYPNTKFYEVRVPKMLGGVLRFEPEKTRKLFELGHDTTIDYFLDHPFQIE